MPRNNVQVLNKGELKLICQIGISAGQVTFGSLFVTLFPIDKSRLPIVLLSLALTLFFWGISWFLTRRFKL